MSKLYFGDFLAGIGGFRQGLEKLDNFKCNYAFDNDSKCKITYDLNFFNPKLDCCDIYDLDSSKLPSLDLIVMGTPCQSFSISGNKKGLNDSRGKVFLQAIELVGKLKPKIVLIENVKNLISHNKGETLKILLEKLNEFGYISKYEVLDVCKHTSIPQHRERIFIVSSYDSNFIHRFSFPKEVNTNDPIELFLSKNIDSKYYYNNRYKIYPLLENSIKETGKFYQYRRTYVRENKSNQCPTLTYNMGSGGHNVPLLKDEYGIRKLTPRECFRFQGFDEEFNLPQKLSDNALYQQVGNSVSPKLIEKIGKQILIALN